MVGRCEQSEGGAPAVEKGLGRMRLERGMVVMDAGCGLRSLVVVTSSARAPPISLLWAWRRRRAADIIS